MENKNFNDDDLYSTKTSEDADFYSGASSDYEPPQKKFAGSEMPTEPRKTSETKPRVFHSRKFFESEEQPAPRKKKLSHAETSGIAISAVMLAYSLSEEDKPLFFLSLSLFIFLLRPLLGAFFGKHSQAVQNALHSFSLVLFIGALIFMFL